METKVMLDGKVITKTVSEEELKQEQLERQRYEELHKGDPETIDNRVTNVENVLSEIQMAYQKGVNDAY